MRQSLVLALGAMLLVLGAMMFLPLLADVQHGHEDWQAFAMASFLTCFLGMAMMLLSWGSSRDFGRHDALAITVLAWLLLPMAGSIPFMLGPLALSFTDALFESMSGLTTTGATILTGLDHMPPGVLLWRGILNWLGGVGILATAVAILPLLQIGGLEIFRLEFTSNMTKVMPRIGGLATWILSIYGGLTIACMASYKISGMDNFDAMVHALTTVSTGGFSTSDLSIGKYVDNIPVQITAIIFMITGALPFLAYIQLIRGNPRPLLVEPQVRALFAILILLVSAVTIFLINQHDMPAHRAFIEAGVNITSIMTGTGYANADYDAWGSEATLLFLAIIFMGGCAGSTCCGVKLFRYQIMFAHLSTQVRRLIHPSGVFEARYAGRRIADSTTSSVFVFLVVFFATFALSASMLAMVGLSPMSAISGAATTLANVGPGVGPEIGPAGNFANIPEAAKWIMTATMYVGRLEIITVLTYMMAMFSRH
tara:strand:- start:39 stop:1484 length:1446 start_codon:yes stop_codon:yes gene_type:complete